VIIAGGGIFLMAASRFVDVSEEEINLMNENAILRKTKHTTMKFSLTSTCMSNSAVGKFSK